MGTSLVTHLVQQLFEGEPATDALVVVAETGGVGVRYLRLDQVGLAMASIVCALPLILPQVWAGLVFGFMRMRLGLGASMLAHAGANLLAIAPTMLGF